jgi:NAD(P)-dependent dehydrogenase (short-subunit alcohol dehydrogenase family)
LANEIHARSHDDKGAKAVEELKTRSGNPAIEFLQADFSSLEEVRRLAVAIIERAPRVDVLVNNAGSSEASYAFGITFAFSRNKFVGSYWFLSATSRG